ncbi:hypothetical protein DAPPUDRAFT_334930 [Daphnia pulex]|uniref:Myb/SANT-like DNA-binding domain-containing protein n=1 Tax=Daphnia pulex TaxID=6669 RepID=E9HWP4_DAPPU|nr:hypothetical protein DAPPUDRAFT_334930 [Daphnia pulex]|eukprot:EFX63836.1 hypothetical protein DAPPUDRAFT_334930 [Daphnia pulex]
MDLLEENLETLCDTKTGKKIILNTIANGLEEAGFANHGSEKGQTCKNKWENLRKEYRTFLSKCQTGSGASATKKKRKFFNEIEKNIGSNNHSYKPPFVSDSLEKTKPSEVSKPNDEITCNNENGEKQDVNQALREKLEKSKKEDKDVSDSPISDTEIYNDSLDEKNSGYSHLNLSVSSFSPQIRLYFTGQYLHLDRWFWLKNIRCLR